MLKNGQTITPFYLCNLFQKLYKKVVTKNFLHENKILYKYQPEFRKSFVTNSHLSLLIDKINKGFESGNYTGLTLFDLPKAFHTVDHEIHL